MNPREESLICQRGDIFLSSKNGFFPSRGRRGRPFAADLSDFIFLSEKLIPLPHGIILADPLI